MKNTLFFLVFLAFSLPAQAAEENDPLLGLWLTKDKDATVEFYRCGETFCGRFYWLATDSAENPSLDEKNKDPALRKKPLCGMTFLGGYVAKGEGLYEDGWLYSPRHGSVFSSQIRLTGPNTLELRGYVFVPFLGGGQTWHRVKDSPVCWKLKK